MKTNKKCIVLDLDNTLWGGVIGEEGMENIALSLTPPGSGFVAFQQALLDHYNRGVILAINSRNNPEDAWRAIRTHPNMILREDNFAAVRMNWNDKVQNLRELAEELNIGLDSMVFLDDDPMNREMVRALLPEVEAPDLPTDPSQLTNFLNSLDYFPAEAFTEEDKMRGNLYVTERLRKEEENSYQLKEDFLRNLSLELSVYKDDDSAVARLAQLTGKTNQFNTNKNPLSEEEIKKYILSPKHIVFHGGLRDKFGDYGIIALALVERNQEAWKVESLLMSCRALGRGAEEAFLGFIAGEALSENAKKLSIVFKETEKNKPAKDFIEKYFVREEYDLSKKPNVPSWMSIKK
ncbi:MAG: hypothetical protein UY23_C0001G0087 [Candidatus Jorgensenbacteria bacterium GW2011_GWA1_48_11]|uniref:Uncharacterized protein n=1 Tax=Candidatus Jorgensenbacteria bacterium GW2011_GWA1_48_11 TaxID=1618660 RepID=A0A0G1UBE1_9BACT|nr:MAG: hypothetical protein UY23_C0001G0087 [Candidatus Jorgensenbacteria bacterium GW2011_GWA1_48_11]KKW11974.1 MAG: hypothetical protein UY51_C0005G0216 [Candidatus Jorgensenbacteria bacterium GW2011_GWB1_49_9]